MLSNEYDRYLFMECYLYNKCLFFLVKNNLFQINNNEYILIVIVIKSLSGNRSQKLNWPMWPCPIILAWLLVQISFNSSSAMDNWTPCIWITLYTHHFKSFNSFPKVGRNFSNIGKFLMMFTRYSFLLKQGKSLKFQKQLLLSHFKLNEY